MAEGAWLAAMSQIASVCYKVIKQLALGSSSGEASNAGNLRGWGMVSLCVGYFLGSEVSSNDHDEKKIP